MWMPMLWLSVWWKQSKRQLTQSAMARENAPIKNQDAAKPGFYAKALDEAERIELEEAATIEGLDNEIAILRVKLRQLLEHYPERVDLQMRAVTMLAQL